MTIRERLLDLLSAKPLTSNEISQVFSDSERPLLEPLLSGLVDEGLVAVEKQSKGRVYSSKQHMDRAFRKQETTSEPELVATLPEQVWSSNPAISDTRGKLRDLIRGTERELVVVEPFIDSFFVEIYSDDFRDLAQRGCRVRLITRKIDKGSEAQKALLRLYEIFATRRPFNGSLDVYEHWYPFHARNGQNYQFVGLHAKVVLNEHEAYIGSANWTEYSLGNNVEFGICLTNPMVLAKLRDVLFLVFTNSRTIELDKMHQNTIDRTRRG